MDPIVELIAGRAARRGLNLTGTVAVERYDAEVPCDARAQRVAPHARSIIVIGNGGGDFWHAYQRHLTLDPSWSARADPLDDFIRQIVSTELLPALERRGMRCVAGYPFTGPGADLRFMDLARLAGLGAPSLLGVLVHPRYGPWMALRAALLIDSEVEQPGEAIGFDPCPRCVSRACIAACPAAAVSVRGWNPSSCMEYRVQNGSECASTCHSRRTCVLSPEARYPDDEIRYHQERALRTMRAYRTKHADRQPDDRG